MMTDKEMIEDMLRMQAKLDETILKESGMTYEKLLDDNLYERAILDELGELNHELKSEWCWWKKTQKPIVLERVLEEFVDVLHFCLSWENAAWKRCEYRESVRRQTVACACLMIKNDVRDDIVKFANALNNFEYVYEGYMELAVGLMNWLNLDLKEVYESYKKKNAVNFQRQREGY